jgi:FKBP-type peptidyl-prolyl cis-trans isomerase
MKKGEKALITILPEYGHGFRGKNIHLIKGSQPNIKPNDIIEFEAELVDWDEAEVMKKVISEGEKDTKETPDQGSDVTVNIKVTLLNGDLCFEKKNFEFVLTDDEFMDCVEDYLLKMKKGEILELKMKPSKHFGDKGNSELNIPKSQTIFILLELIDFKNPNFDYDELKSDQKIEKSKELKEHGNELFKSKKYLHSIRYYKEALDAISYDDEPGSEDEELDFNVDQCIEIRALRIVNWNNIASVNILLKLGTFNEKKLGKGDKIHDKGN